MASNCPMCITRKEHDCMEVLRERLALAEKGREGLREVAYQRLAILDAARLVHGESHSGPDGECTHAICLEIRKYDEAQLKS